MVVVMLVVVVEIKAMTVMSVAVPLVRLTFAMIRVMLRSARTFRDSWLSSDNSA